MKKSKCRKCPLLKTSSHMAWTIKAMVRYNTRDDDDNTAEDSFSMKDPDRPRTAMQKHGDHHEILRHYQ